MKNKKGIILIAMCFAGALVIYSIFIEPYWLEIKHLHFGKVGSTGGLRGKKAVHISDMHIRDIGRREKKLLKLISEINPDMIFLSGDYVR